jgi:hypothetical protein
MSTTSSEEKIKSKRIKTKNVLWMAYAGEWVPKNHVAVDSLIDWLVSVKLMNRNTFSKRLRWDLDSWTIMT